MDPQQRLLLEVGYASLHGAQRRTTLMGGNDGVFLGIERPDWALAQPPPSRGSVYAVTGDNVSAAAGRVFVPGLQGPCLSVDTACSSALAAAHGGAHVVRGGESSGGLALAVSLKLVLHGTLGAASAGMLSVDGPERRRRACQRVCAPGGRGRSCAVLLREVETRASDAARQCGASGRSVGEPDGAQWLGAAHAAARRARLGGIGTAGGGCVEAHGTGTALGDPTEAGALAAVHGFSAERTAAAVVCAVKASVGHSEASSGQVGLLRSSESVGAAGWQRAAALAQPAGGRAAGLAR